MKKLRIILALIIVGALTISALTLLLPSPADAEIRQYYSPIATSVTLVDALFAIGSAVLFIMALRNFKAELKPAYRLMALSALTVGLLMPVIPYIEYYGLWENVYLNMSSYLQFLVGAPLMYLGVRMFYKKLGFTRKVSSLLVIGGVIAAAVIVHAFMPHFDVWPEFSELQYDLFEIVPIIPVIAYAAALFMMLSVRHKVGQEYRRAFGWLSLGLACYTFSTGALVVLETVGYENWYFSNRIYSLPSILGDASLLMAGYYFNAVGKPGAVARRGWLRRLFGGRASEKVTSVDIIVYVAQLASDPSKIDDYLDGMRVVTANRQLDNLSQQDQHTLRGVYMKLEAFLATQDPLRSFRRSELRANVSKHFGLEGNTETNTFWPLLPALARESTTD